MVPKHQGAILPEDRAQVNVKHAWDAGDKSLSHSSGRRVIEGREAWRVRVGFEVLLERHEKEIYRFARRMTANREDASDVLQDTFLQAFRAFKKLPEDANHRAWLYRIASRLAMNLARAKRVRKAVPIETVFDLPERDGDLEALVETRRLARSLAQVVLMLPRRPRVALLQRKYEGKVLARYLAGLVHRV